MVPQRLQEDLYMMDDGRVRQFLILGRNTAFLLDTGFTDGDVLAAVRTITDAPLQVLLTHGDLDHAGAWAILKRHGCTRRIGTWCMLPPGCIRCGRGTRFAAGTGNFRSSRSRGTHMAVLLLQILRRRCCFPAILCKRADQFTSSAVTAT